MKISLKLINEVEEKEYEFLSIRIPEDGEDSLIYRITALDGGDSLDFSFVLLNKEGSHYYDSYANKYCVEGYSDFADVIPIIKVKEVVEEGKWYQVRRSDGSRYYLPFVAMNEHELLCAGKINYICSPETGDEFDEIIDNSLDRFIELFVK